MDYSNIEDVSAVLRFYDPAANIMYGEGMLPEITECSIIAIGEYNNSNVIGVSISTFVFEWTHPTLCITNDFFAGNTL